MESEEEKWHDCEGGGMEWIMIAGERINNVKKAGYLEAKELRLERMGVRWIKDEYSWEY